MKCNHTKQVNKEYVQEETKRNKSRGDYKVGVAKGFFFVWKRVEAEDGTYKGSWEHKCSGVNSVPIKNKLGVTHYSLFFTLLIIKRKNDKEEQRNRNNIRERSIHPSYATLIDTVIGYYQVRFCMSTALVVYYTRAIFLGSSPCG